MGIRIDSSSGANVVSCASCGEVIYPDAVAIARHHIEGLPDGRTRVYSFDFERTVHLCAEDTTVVAEAERVLEVAARPI